MADQVKAITTALDVLHLGHDDVATRAAVIALIEEGGKLLTVLFLANVLLRRQFNDPMDGLIYGRLAGLGMAVNESMLYLSLHRRRCKRSEWKLSACSGIR